MANPEHLKILKQGVEQWNNWGKQNLEVHANLRDADLGSGDLREAYLRWADLRRANLKGAVLIKADLRGTDLAEADLSGAILSGADFYAADLSRAVLAGAKLGETNLRRANLSQASLVGASLGGANLSGANMRNADLGGARVAGTYFNDVDLSGTKGLETVEHNGPSTIGIDTIYKSRGKIPEAFLRGCGVPENFIAYMHSLAGQAFEFYSCFISYSTKDQEFADRLYADLQAKGVRCWFAPHEMQGGKPVHEQIDQALRRYEKLLLILSEHSIASGWVETEIANAWERQTQQRKNAPTKHVLFPVRLVSFEALENWRCPDPTTGRDLAREIRRYFIPDFSNWKDHDSYQAAFQRLVRDLKADGGGAQFAKGNRGTEQ